MLLQGIQTEGLHLGYAVLKERYTGLEGCSCAILYSSFP